MHISEGHEIEAESAYTTVYLAVVASMQLSAHTQTLSATGFDAKRVLDNISGLKRKLRHVNKGHYFLLQCIDEAIHCRFPLPYTAAPHLHA